MIQRLAKDIMGLVMGAGETTPTDGLPIRRRNRGSILALLVAITPGRDAMSTGS